MIVGTLILNPTKQNIISLGKGKFDFILLDFQHSAFTWETADYVIETVYTYTDKKIWIRVANNNFSDINRAYDIGADAVVVPLINTMNDLKNCINAARYKPLGNRSWGPVRLRENYRSYEDYFINAHSKQFLFPQIESLQGLNNLSEMCTLDGWDGVMIGPSDLAISMGEVPNFPPKSQLVKDKMEEIINICKSKNKIPGLFAGSLDVAKEFVSKGAECFTYGSDLEFLDKGTKISFENLYNSMK
jgi:2-keto-3-deoxy-L-rhamnonate aldolase RhmA